MKEEKTMRTKNESRWVYRKPRNAEYKHTTQNGEKVYKDEKYCYVEYVSEWDGKRMYYRFRRMS